MTPRGEFHLLWAVDIIKKTRIVFVLLCCTYHLGLFCSNFVRLISGEKKCADPFSTPLKHEDGGGGQHERRAPLESE